jgi:hypothetical protein
MSNLERFFTAETRSCKSAVAGTRRRERDLATDENQMYTDLVNAILIPICVHLIFICG